MFWKFVFKNLLQIVKGIWIRFWEAFSRFEIFSPISNVFPLTKQKLPLNEILLLVFKRVLKFNFEEGIPIWNYIKNKIPIEKNIS
jgi:hypothetical protein